MHERAVLRVGLAFEQTRIAGKTHRLLGNAARAYIESSVAVAIDEQLNGIATWRYVIETQAVAVTADLPQRHLPIVIIRRMQRSMHNTAILTVQLQPDVGGLRHGYTERW